MGSTRAYNEILNWLLIQAQTGFLHSEDMEVSGCEGVLPKDGDLVVMQYAPPSPWKISWYHKEGSTSNHHVLESCLDGSLCRWSNIGMTVVRADKVPDSWRWTDKQYDFWDKWQRAWNRSETRFSYRPNAPVFDGLEVTISLRRRWSVGEEPAATKTFDNWKKVLSRDMTAFCNSMENNNANNIDR